MADFGYAHAVAEQWQEACATALSELGEPPAQGQLGFVYAHHAFAADMDSIVDRLRESTGIAHWAGTVGMGVCSTGRECYDEPSLAVLATDIPDGALQMVPTLTTGATALLAATADWRRDHGAHFGIVHADPVNRAVPQLIAELANGLESGYLVGGLTSSEDVNVQVADRAESGGMSGVLLSSDVAVATGLSQGCTLIGRKHEITACEQNVIAEIDGRNAIDVLKEDIGEVLARDLRRISGYIFAALPISGSDTGDYLIRNLLGIDPAQGLLAIGELVDIGMSIQFAKRDVQTARDDLSGMVHRLRARLPGPAKGALYHSCLGRGRHLFGEDSAELRLVQQELGDVPLIGFYANGEISHNRLYGYTGVLTVFC